ncbi:MAG: preprotein translocase subunit SecE [Porphyromonas sp.]|nr:preprotein translocase subunit SecE [Porphyromonas sp.]
MSIVSRIGTAFKDSYTELTQKVTWPTRQELTGSSIIVLIASIIIALFVTSVDGLFNWVLTFVYKALA